MPDDQVMDAPVISHVSDTARWVAMYRALESERPDAIFHDPFARRLAGERGEAILAGMPKGRAMSWPIVVRTAVMDEIILASIARRKVDVVLDLAAGLDARPWRLALPAALTWVDVDHPEMIQYKATSLAGIRPACGYEGVGVDLAEEEARRDLFARIGTPGKPVLVITEGLLVYLAEEAVAGLAADLHAQPAFRYWLTDLASPALLKMLAKNWGPVVAAGNAPFRFGPADGPGFFGGLGWREIEYRPTFHEGLRLNRTFPMARFWFVMGKLRSKRRQEEFKRFSGIALLERDG